MTTKFKINQQIENEIKKLAETDNISLRDAAEKLHKQFADDNLLYSMGQVSGYIEALDNKDRKAFDRKMRVKMSMMMTA